MRFLVLLMEAFAGRGGVALYSRDLLIALRNHRCCTGVTAVARLPVHGPGEVPEGIDYVAPGVHGKAAYLHAVWRAVRRHRHFDLIVCAHIHLLPVACIARKLVPAPILLVLYGVDAWQPTRSRWTNRLVREADAFLAISNLTRRRFLGWAGVNGKPAFVLPNAIHLAGYGLKAKSPVLLERYGLAGKTVLMSLGRMSSSERSLKGFDRVLEVVPDLARHVPGLVYLAAGDGDDRPRLEAKARRLGIQDRVVFPGYIAEREKADHYRLADVFVMPSRGEGFGFVFLEAMACGVPVVASKADGGREALLDGELGILVDPENPEELKAAIQAALRLPRVAPRGLESFAFANFQRRLHSIVDEVAHSACKAARNMCK